jgi:hypothetical protein
VAGFLRGNEPGVSRFAVPLTKFAAACFPLSPLMSGYAICILLHGKKGGFRLLKFALKPTLFLYRGNLFLRYTAA